MEIKSKIIKEIIKLLFESSIVQNDDTLIVALSGGPDSMCLIDVLYKIKTIYDFNLMAVHVNHGIRGIESNSDEDFVKKYCKDMGIELITKKVDAVKYAKENKYTLEEAARILRYEIIDKLWMTISNKNKNNNTYVLVAQHLNDQVETIIHNMVRGTGLKGFSGIKKVNRYILRPMLNLSRNEINAYNNDYGVPYVIDSTNSDTNYTRNYIRTEIVDKLLKVNDKALVHISELASIINESDEYLNSLSKFIIDKICIDKNKNEIILNLKEFNFLPHIIKSYVVRIVFAELISTLKDVTNVNIEDVIVLASKIKGGHLDMPYNITIDKLKNELKFIHNNKNISISRRKKK